ncbi:MAG: hypothetical protein AB1488_03095 [Nitrospirota bacterium]
MGSHTWTTQCPHCSFEEMIVSGYDAIYFEVICPMCEYERWTEEKIPDNQDVELAKRKLAEMGAKEKQKATELYYEDNIPFITRLKKKNGNI